jgi:hypothetical protein
MKFEVDKVVLREVSRRVLMLSPLSIILRMLHTLLQLHVADARLMYTMTQIPTTSNTINKRDHVCESSHVE